MKELTAKQLRNKVVNELWSYGNLPKNIQEFMGDEVAFMIEIIDTKVKEQLALSRVVGQSEQFYCLEEAAKGDKCKSECALCEGMRKQ